MVIHMMRYSNNLIEILILILEIGIQKGGSLLAWKDYLLILTFMGRYSRWYFTEYRREDFNYIISDIKSNSVRKYLKISHLISW
jgi:hypothetical protein